MYDFKFQFVRKVYATLLIQLLITLGFIAVFVFTPTIKDFYCTETYTDGAIVHCLRKYQSGNLRPVF